MVEEGDGIRSLAERALTLGLIPPEEFSQAGWLIGDRYRVAEVIGRGGAGTVLRGVDEHVGRAVALKLLDGDALSSVSRFEEEIRVLAALDHPGIVTIYGSGVHDGVPYYVMEHAPQGTLAEASLDLRAWGRVFLQVCLAVGAAHKRNIVHRDLKPENVLMIDGAPRVADFGVAKRLNLASPHPTQAGFLVGTPRVMAPEQLEGGEIGPWTDVHALGVMLYERLTGHPPFSTEHGFMGLSAAVLDSKRPDPLDLAPEAPRELVRVAVRALAREPEERYADADAMTRELRDWLQGNATPAGDLPKRSPLQPLAALSGLGALLVLAGVLWGSSSDPGAQRSLAAPSPSPVLPPSPKPASASPKPSPPPPSPASSSQSRSFEPTSPEPSPAPKQEGLPLSPASLNRLRQAIATRADATTLERLSRFARRHVWGSLGVARLLNDERPELGPPLARLLAQVEKLPASAARGVALGDLTLFKARFVEVTPFTLRSARGPIQAAIALKDSPAARLSDVTWALVMVKLSVDLPRFVRLRGEKIREHQEHYQASLEAARARGSDASELEALEAVRESLK